MPAVRGREARDRRFAVQGEHVEDDVRQSNRAVAMQEPVADEREVRPSVSEGDLLAVEDTAGWKVGELRH
jgi:hypothetical protein